MCVYGFENYQFAEISALKISNVGIVSAVLVLDIIFKRVLFDIEYLSDRKVIRYILNMGITRF